ncbi:family 20 glycosylhydrolase [Specibacter sp. NPDC078692]|uniref:family 20 glycosylhydrolase n=1 Tax=Specibacter sp. NPDC078692 TaxID=3155818 RepID=UPI00342409F3
MEPGPVVVLTPWRTITTGTPGTFLPGVGEDRVLGVETVQWGEWFRGMEQTESYQYPRSLATAEVGWSAQANNRRYDDFVQRAGALGGRNGAARSDTPQDHRS